MKKFCAIFFLCAMLVGCVGEPTPTPLPTPRPFATATRTSTATPVPSATVSPTVSPSPTTAATPLPTQTATLIPTITRTPTLTAVPSPTPATAAAEAIVCTLLIAQGQPGPMYALIADNYCSLSRGTLRLLVSSDYGSTWTSFSGGVPVSASCLHNINLDYATADGLYASTCQGLYRWRQNRWDQISSQETEMVAVVYGQLSTIFGTARTDKGGPVIRSTDGGRTWAGAATGLVHFNGVANLAIDPRSSNVLYAIIWPKYAGSYLRRGTATGNWSTMPTPLNNGQIEIGMTIDGASGALYVTAYDSFQTSGEFRARMELWRTTDPSRPDVNAVQWEMIYDFGENVIAQVLASGWSRQGLALYVRLSPTNCNYLTDASCVTSIQRSLDGGKTWTPLVIK